MNEAHELLERLQQDGAARFASTRLARGHAGVTRRVRRDRAVRSSLLTVTGVAAAGGVAFAVAQSGVPGPVPPATANPAAPTPSASDAAPAITTVSVGKQERIEDIAVALENAVGSPGDDAMAALINALPPEANGNPEGWVLAGDYGFDEQTNLQAAAVQMVETMTTHLQSAGVPREQWLDTVILASIVQAEAAVLAEQGSVARVLVNRLGAGMKLEIESPLAYYLHADTEPVGDDGWAVDTPYNTFMYEGLPPSAVGAPTPESLDAAVNPSKGDWMYKLVKPNGNTLLFVTFDDYAKAVDEYFPGTGASE